MKTFSQAYSNHLNSKSTTLAEAILIVRPDKTVYGFTSNNDDFSMDISAWNSKYDLGVTNLPSSGISLGEPVIYTKTAFGTQVDEVSPGLVIFRGNEGGSLYNTVLEEYYSYLIVGNTSPEGTLWMKLEGTEEITPEVLDSVDYTNLDNYHQSLFDAAWEGGNWQTNYPYPYPGMLMNNRYIMVDNTGTVPVFYTVTFTSWTNNSQGSAVSYTRRRVQESAEFTFSSGQGFTASNISSNRDMSVDNLELVTFNDGSLFTEVDLLQNRWQESKFIIFRYNWSQNTVLAEDTDILLRGYFGEVSVTRNEVKIELRSLSQLLQQPVGIVSSKTCRARFGDKLCRKDLSALTYTDSVTSSASNTEFYSSGLSVYSNDTFNNGIVTFNTGNNAGLSQRVLFSSSGNITLQFPTIMAISAGDTFTIVAGCDKTLLTCRDKYNNVLNFQGEPHRPTTDAVTSSPSPYV